VPHAVTEMQALKKRRDVTSKDPMA
jgi:hypothetical protein